MKRYAVQLYCEEHVYTVLVDDGPPSVEADPNSERGIPWVIATAMQKLCRTSVPGPVLYVKVAQAGPGCEIGQCNRGIYGQGTLPVRFSGSVGWPPSGNSYTQQG